MKHSSKETIPKSNECAHRELYRGRDKQLENAFNQVHTFQILEGAELLEVVEEEIPQQTMNGAELLHLKVIACMNMGEREILIMVT